MSPSSQERARSSGIRAFLQRKWVRIAALVVAVPVLVFSFVAGYYYVTFGRMIDQQLHGERQRAPGGGIEEADVARNVEQRALTGQHGRDLGR